jgi:ATP-dependent Lon protease
MIYLKFIATSNNMGAIQPALRDRMEIIKMWPQQSKKVEIAKQHSPIKRTWFNC